MSFRELAAKLPPRGWAVLSAAVLGSVLVLYLIFHLASQPSYTTLVSGVQPSQVGQIESTLSSAGITYQLQTNGTAVAVPASDASQARVALAGANLLGSAQPGFSLYDKSQLGQSDAQAQVEYQRALEGQLDNTISTIQGVTSAQVQLVLPNPQEELFADSESQSTAAVLLGGGDNLDPAQIQGIARLVSSSVQGLSLSNVTITDDTGALLWPTSDATSGGGALSQQQADQSYDNDEASKVDSMLAQTLGPDMAMVTVNANVNANQVSQQSLTYGAAGVPLTQSTTNESLKGSGVNTGGTAGTIPTYASTGTTGAQSYTNTTKNTTYGVSKTVTNTTVAPGAINGIKAALFVSNKVPAATVASLKTAVSSALGLVPTRGDVLSVAQIPFSNTAATTSTKTALNPIAYAKYVAIGLGALIFLFFMSRAIRKREKEGLAGEPTWLRELEHRRPVSEFELEPPEEVGPIKQLRSPVNTAKRQVEDLVERDPDRVAMQVRAWMAED